ncbi:MAG: hypothetical protein AAF639_38305 [Chloroflexota bacterium]
MTEQTIPESWKTDHLILLVGSNPLPNYVAAQLLLKDGGTLHLICSVQTSEIAEQLANALKNNHIMHIARDDTDHGEISSRVEAALTDTKRISGTDNPLIGLNFTGGTKAMSVFVYQAVRDAFPEAVFTYLDASTLTMQRQGYPTQKPMVKYDVKPKIRELIWLHGIEIIQKVYRTYEPVPQPQQDLMMALARAHRTQDGQIAYNQWCQQYLRAIQTAKKLREARDLLGKLQQTICGFMHNISCTV